LALSDAERATLGEIDDRPGRKALGEMTTAALPDTVMGWYRKLVARKFDGSRARQAPGRLPISKEIQELIVRMAKEKSVGGCDRTVGALNQSRLHQCEAARPVGAAPPQCQRANVVVRTWPDIANMGACRWRYSMGFPGIRSLFTCRRLSRWLNDYWA
jgi:hypothetical protein